MNSKTKNVISRKDAVKKLGYAAFAASTMLLLLNAPSPLHAQGENSPGNPGGGGNDEWDD